MFCLLYLLFFFFQAEDGIRDYKVTGVQTCALPIYDQAGGDDDTDASTRASQRHSALAEQLVAVGVPVGLRLINAGVRSEERRVGKECRARSWMHHLISKG